MERRPLSEETRLYAAFAYVFPVSLVLLCLPKMREIRLVRLHSIQALLLFLSTILSLMLTSLFFALLGPLGVGVLLFGGVVMLLILLASSVLTGVSVLAAYQGQIPGLPLLAPLIKTLDRKIKRRFGIT